MEPTDVTVQILKEIRDQIQESNVRLEKLERRQVESEVRLATELIAVAGAVREVKQLLAERLDVRDRLVKCETEIHDIKKHIGMP